MKKETNCHFYSAEQKEKTNDQLKEELEKLKEKYKKLQAHYKKFNITEINERFAECVNKVIGNDFDNPEAIKLIQDIQDKFFTKNYYALCSIVFELEE